MKRVSFIFVIVFSLVCTIQAQIKTIEVAPKKIEQPAIERYDSTINFVGKNVHFLVGQTLYAPHKRSTLRPYGFSNLYSDYRRTRIANKSDVYDCCEGSSYNTKYNSIAGKYYRVLRVIDHPEKLTNPRFHSDDYFLELKDSITGDIIYFLYQARYTRSFYWVVMGFYEKQKTNAIGMEFVIRGRNWRETVSDEDKPMYDIKTGLQVPLIPGSIWRVTDLVFEQEYFSLSYVICNDSGQTLTLDIESIENTGAIRVYKKADVQFYIDNFPLLWQKVVEGKILVGMSKDMVLLSWGKPERINTLRGMEQWVYGSQYVYLVDDLVTSVE